MEYAKLLLNKAIEDGDITALDRYAIEESDMPSDVDRATLRFMREYAAENGGQAPSYATVAASVDGFDYIPEVSDSYEWLARQVKGYSAKQAIAEWFLPPIDARGNVKRDKDGKPMIAEFQRRFDEMDGAEFFDKWLLPEIEKVKMRTSVRSSIGTDVKKDADKFMAEYERRKAGESFRVWKSKFSAIGEYISGNLYTVFGKSGRGKSVTTLEDGIYAATQGANVLIWAMEMGWYEVMVRIYVSLSGEEGVTTAHLNGVDMSAGFNSRDVRLGALNDEFEPAFRSFIGTLNDKLPGNITVRAVDDPDFTDRSLRALKADIEATDADVVIVDPFYYMDYERNTSNTTGGDAANTSNRLRRLAGNTSTAIIAITQAEEGKESAEEDGERELALPERKDVKKTKGLLEDAALLIGVDSDYKQGRALVGVFKGRDGGEGNTCEVLYMPQFGVVRELETGEAAVGDFDF